MAADRPLSPRKQNDKSFTVSRELAAQVIAYNMLRLIMPTVMRLLRLALSRLAAQVGCCRLTSY